jgi:murein L,D-transpeptidase YcbB/YkuD
MNAPKLSGITTGLALALALTTAGAAPAFAQADGASVPPAAMPDAAAIERGVPLPDFIDLKPLTPADVGAPESPAPAAAAAEPAPATTTAPAKPAQAEAPAPAQASETAAAPAEPVNKDAAEVPTPMAPAPATTAASSGPPPMTAQDIQNAIPVPEPAGVAPPTAQDIGTPPPPAADVAIADALRPLVAGKLNHYLDRKRDREALEAFYAARNFVPLWFAQGQPTKTAAAAIARLRQAEADGLDANDYPTPDLKTLAADPDARAQAELRLTSSILSYAREAQSGRVIPSRISTNIEFSPPVPDPAAVLEKVAKADDIAKTLDAFNPQHDGFRALKRKLAELRGKTENDKIVHVPTGPTLRIGTIDERVPLVRERLGVSGEGNVYDANLAQAVKAFQREKGIGADGMLGPHTLDVLNGGRRSTSTDIKAIVSNMERWRWLPRDLGHGYVMVNIPDFTLKVVKDHRTAFHTRIVVGKPATPSPNFAAAIENILVNPTWHVPQSIIYNEYLPALREDPTVLARMGLVMEHNRDGSISIRQPPGERNALGRIKFNFPNRFQVYLHDTPDKNLFSQERRAYSHGCMRVQNPTQFGEVLASIGLPGENITAERLHSMFGTGERWLNFKHKVPVYLVYFNAYVDDAGKLVVRPDLYGYDQRVQSALRGQYMAVFERSQRVSPTAMRRARQIVQEVPRYQQRSFFFPFPWLQ